MSCHEFCQQWLSSIKKRVLLLVLLVFTSWTLAAGLQVTPITLDIAAEQQGQILVLSNTGTQPIRAQVRVQRWIQQDATEQLTATKDLVVSPPIIELAMGAKQAVRIVKMYRSQTGAEHAYRLFIDELPADLSGATSKEAPQNFSLEGQGLQFLLRYSIPVFVAEAHLNPPVQPLKPSGERAKTSPPLARVIWGNDPSTTVLELENRESRRVKLSQLIFISKSGQRQSIFGGLMGYVLTGQRMRWSIELPQASVRSGGIFMAKLNDDLEEQLLPLEAQHP